MFKLRLDVIKAFTDANLTSLKFFVDVLGCPLKFLADSNLTSLETFL